MFNRLQELKNRWNLLRPHLRAAFSNSFNQVQFWVGTAFGVAGYVVGHALGWWWFQ